MFEQFYAAAFPHGTVDLVQHLARRPESDARG
jgi:hypothetical protein